MYDNQLAPAVSRYQSSHWNNSTMANNFNLSPSSSAAIPGGAAPVLIERFQVRISVHIRITNTTANIVTGLKIWCCYEPNVTTPGVKDVLLWNMDVKPNESIAVDAGPFNFQDGGSIFATCDTANVLAMHISKATY